MEDIIRMDIKEKVVNTWNWIDSAQDRLLYGPRESGIGLPDSISHVVCYYYYVFEDCEVPIAPRPLVCCGNLDMNE